MFFFFLVEANFFTGSLITPFSLIALKHGCMATIYAERSAGNLK